MKTQMMQTIISNISEKMIKSENENFQYYLSKINQKN